MTEISYMQKQLLQRLTPLEKTGGLIVFGEYPLL